jgi:hypothetical protein
VANEAFIEDFVNRLAVVNRALWFARYTRANIGAHSGKRGLGHLRERSGNREE